MKISATPMPAIEALLEVLLTKSNAADAIKTEPLLLVNDLTKYLNGHTISYLEFS